MHSQSQNKNPPAPLPNSPVCLHLPQEIIEEILSRLPVKPLLRFRCVSKSWLFLIKSDRFINKHLKTSKKDTNWAHHRLFFHVTGRVMKGCSLPSLLNSALPSSSINPYPLIINSLRKRISFVVGCCKGVLCLLSNSYPRWTFSLSNPATRVSMELPELLDIIFLKSGFGWDESSGAFKVFTSSCQSRSNSRLGHVYSSKTNSWKTVRLGSSSLDNPFGAFAGGRLHWDARIDHDHEYVIESFNLENDIFGRIELPPSYANAYEGDRPPYKLLGEIGGCLCALFDDYKKRRVNVWVMKEYGVKDSWIKLLTFPHAAAYSVFHQLGEGPNGEIFLIYDNTLAVYDDISSRATATKIDLIDSYIPAGIYVESLVSPRGGLLLV